METQRRVTITDVARVAGVSIARGRLVREVPVGTIIAVLGGMLLVTRYGAQ